MLVSKAAVSELSSEMDLVDCPVRKLSLALSEIELRCQLEYDEAQLLWVGVYSRQKARRIKYGSYKFKKKGDGNEKEEVGQV